VSCIAYIISKEVTTIQNYKIISQGSLVYGISIFFKFER